MLRTGSGVTVGPTATIVLLWLAFALSHMLLSSVRLRPRIVAAIGPAAFQAGYSLIALAIFVPLVWTYFDHKHQGPMLWAIPIGDGLHWVMNIGMGVAFVLLIGGVVNASPASMTAERSDGPAKPSGIHFITRHAVFMGTGLFGLLHLIPNGFATDVAFFGGFPLFALAGSIHQDRRKLQTDALRYRAFHDATPLLPFTGKETMRGLRELSKLGLVIGVALTVLVRYFHASWFS
jgi:uncharacterized membrane protein